MEHKYTDVSIEDRDEHDDSSTEVGESLIGRDDKEWKSDLEHSSRRKSRTRKICAVVGSWRWVLDTVLLMIILGLLVDKKLQARPTRKSRSYELAGDLTGFAPRCKSIGLKVPLGLDIANVVLSLQLLSRLRRLSLIRGTAPRMRRNSSRRR
jgi:hypothetical protein